MSMLNIYDQLAYDHNLTEGQKKELEGDMEKMFNLLKQTHAKDGRKEAEIESEISVSLGERFFIIKIVVTKGYTVIKQFLEVTVDDYLDNINASQKKAEGWTKIKI